MVVCPCCPMCTVEVEVTEVVVVEVSVMGEITVKVPDGVPEAIFLVAVRVNVDVEMMVVVHAGGGEIGLAGVAVAEEMRHWQAEDTNLESYGSNPENEYGKFIDLTFRPSAIVCSWLSMAFIVPTHYLRSRSIRVGNGRSSCINRVKLGRKRCLRRLTLTKFLNKDYRWMPGIAYRSQNVLQ